MYKWKTAHEWLEHHLRRAYYGGPGARTELLHCARNLANKLDADQIQDIFEADMDADGYFDKEKK